jgi:hypothetical protein
MALGITCNNPPTAVIGRAGYSHFFPVSGDTPPDAFTITVGALPAGLALNAVTGEVTGTPTGPAGLSSFTIQVQDSTMATATADCSITVNAALTLSCNNPPSGAQGQPYSHSVAAAGGVTPYTFAISAGALPAGLSLDASSGAITGTPSLAGTFNFTVRVTDSYAGGGAANTTTAACSIIINSNLAIGCGDPPTAHVGVAYSHTCPATGGTAPYTYSLLAGTLPTGLSLNAATGEISGTPTTKQTRTFTIQVTDSLDAEAQTQTTIRVTGNCLQPPTQE